MYIIVRKKERRCFLEMQYDLYFFSPIESFRTLYSYYNKIITYVFIFTDKC